MQETAARKGQVADVALSAVVTSAKNQPARAGGASLGGVDIQPFALQPPFTPRSDGRYHVSDLLKYHDRNFIQNAYRAILKRGPDAVGYKGFIESLRSARLNKIDILARLRYSSEGRAKKTEIAGLLAPALIRKAYRVPFIGYLLNLGIAFIRLPMMIRNQQQFEAHVLAQQEMIAEQLNHVGRTLRTHANETALIIEKHSELIRQMDDSLQGQFNQLREHAQQQSEQTRRQLAEQMQAQLDETQKHFAAIQAQLDLTREQVDDSQRHIKDSERQIADMQRQITGAEQQIIGIHPQVAEMQRQVADIQPQIKESQRQFEALARQQADSRSEVLRSQAAQADQLESRLGEIAKLVEVSSGELRRETDSRIVQEIAQLQHELWAMGKEIGEKLGETTFQWQEELRALDTLARQWREEVRVGETAFHQADLLQSEQLELTTKNLQREIDRVLQKHQQVNAELVLQRQRVGSLLDEARKRLPSSFDKKQLRKIAAEGAHSLDAFYASFDDQFRGTRAEIKKRLRIYLPILRKQGIGTAAMPVLDVGCGRGEWLELLQEQDLDATGIDTNRVLIGQCREIGLKVIEEDLLKYLHGVADNALGAVTGFHIVEHLPLEALTEFLDQTVRVLKPGGLVIFETPNPHNVLVGSCNFYFDPTHRNPIPSQVLSFLIEARGFVDVQVMNLNPSDDTPVDDDSELAKRFNEYFYGPMDYAVVGYRP